MTFLAGEVITAARLNRLKPRKHNAACTSDLAGSVTDTDVPGATVTFTTETADAEWEATAAVDFDTTGAGTTTVGNCKCAVDGSPANSSRGALMQAGAATANDRNTSAQQWEGTLATPGTHTIKLFASVPANMKVNAIHTTLRVTVQEVV